MASGRSFRANKAFKYHGGDGELKIEKSALDVDPRTAKLRTEMMPAARMTVDRRARLGLKPTAAPRADELSCPYMLVPDDFMNEYSAMQMAKQRGQSSSGSYTGGKSTMKSTMGSTGKSSQGSWGSTASQMGRSMGSSMHSTSSGSSVSSTKNRRPGGTVGKTPSSAFPKARVAALTEGRRKAQPEVRTRPQTAVERRVLERKVMGPSTPSTQDSNAPRKKHDPTAFLKSQLGLDSVKQLVRPASAHVSHSSSSGIRQTDVAASGEGRTAASTVKQARHPVNRLMQGAMKARAPMEIPAALMAYK